MKAFALVSDLGGIEAVEIYLREQDAVEALDAALRDVPEWADVLHVEAVDLDDLAPNRNLNGWPARADRAGWHYLGYSASALDLMPRR